MFKSYLTGISFGALASLILMSWIAPRTIGWYFEPPVEIGVNCRPAADWAMGKLLIAQVISVIVGGVVGLIATYLLVRKKDSVS